MAVSTTKAQAPDYASLIDGERIHGSLYTDAAVFADEMEQIFHNGWVFVAHDSEVPRPGDFVTRRLGLQSVIVSRDLSGECRVMFNRCPHRGAVVCQSESGHRRSLTCPYHGWTFALDGKLMGVPSPSAYPQDGAKPAGLSHAARVGVYGGFIFASLSDAGPTLETHLGKARLG